MSYLLSDEFDEKNGEGEERALKNWCAPRERGIQKGWVVYKRKERRRSWGAKEKKKMFARLGEILQIEAASLIRKVRGEM